MIKNCTDNFANNENIKWLDLVSPTKEELEEISIKYSLDKDLLLKCLSPIHLPKLQKEKDYYFIVLRLYDETSYDADSVQAFTNKIVLFVNEHFLISIHRKEEAFFTKFIESIYEKNDFFKHNKSYDVLLKIIKIVILSFETPLHKNELALDDIEQKIFLNNSLAEICNHIYYIKRSTAIVRRTLWQIDAIIQSLFEILPQQKNKLNLIKADSDRLQYLAEELEFTAQNIASLQIALASHKTSEVMRTLAFFSVFFMPLTFIVGIYGMNFRVMPELNWEYGYPAIILVLIVTSILLFFWFKKKGWYNFN